VRRKDMKTVVPDDFPPVYQGTDDLTPLETFGEVVVYGSRAGSQEELIERMQEAGAVVNVRSYTTFSEELLAALPELKILSILGTGTDNVDLAAATRLGIAVTNTPGVHAVSVAELTFSLILTVARHLLVADGKMREGEWYHQDGVELRGKTLGLVGLGAIGQEVARIGSAFGFRLIGWSPTRDAERAQKAGVKLVELEELLRQADVVSLHVRASEETAGMIGRREFEMMKPSAILVNTARAALTDEEALVEALKEGKILGAGIDVFWQEPIPADHPLLGLENVVLSPHVGWVTHEASARLRKLPVDNIIAYLSGHPQHVVNHEVLG
jgi:D-3-phosphoglycerate dehydrogenase